MQDEFDQVDELVDKVMQDMRSTGVDFRIAYETEYRTKNPNDGNEVTILMVEKAIHEKEKGLLVAAMDKIVGSSVPSHVRFMVMRRVKELRATHTRRNKYKQLQRKSYAELKKEKVELERKASRKLERELDRPVLGMGFTPLPPSVKPRPMQQHFGEILDEADDETRRHNIG